MMGLSITIVDYRGITIIKFNSQSFLIGGAVATYSLINPLKATAGVIVYNGGTFGVEAQIGLNTNQVDYTYTADFTDPGWNADPLDPNYVDPVGYITSIAFKLEGYKATSIDAFSTDASGVWDPVIGGLSAQDCMDNPNNGFLCAEEDYLTITGPSTLAAGMYTWDFTITHDQIVDVADFLSETNHIKAHFVSCPGDPSSCGNAGNLSDNINFGPNPGTEPDPSVPVPGTLFLLGLGLAGLARSQRRY